MATKPHNNNNNNGVPRRVFDNVPPNNLNERSIEGIAEYMQADGLQNNVFVMCGAGISTSAGIPDFRSPKTGLYANLARLNLPHPEAVFELSYFARNPQPFYTLASEIAPGRFTPTITHAFIRLLYEKGLLHTCITQNIDTLERLAGIPASKIVEAHGSFATQRCIKCRIPFDDEKMKEHIKEAKIPHCEVCKGLVKPNIVFFGESLPESFFNIIPSVRDAGLVIVIGTSLQVHPFAMLPSLVPEDCPRLLLNLEKVGDFGTRSDDVVFLAECDLAVRKLAGLMGWSDDLNRLWKEVGGVGIDDGIDDAKENKDATSAAAAAAAVPPVKPNHPTAEELVDHLVNETERALRLSNETADTPSVDSSTLEPNPPTHAPTSQRDSPKDVADKTPTVNVPKTPINNDSSTSSTQNLGSAPSETLKPSKGADEAEEEEAQEQPLIKA